MKKFLSLVLALVMTMSLVTVSAGAKDFTDNSKIAYDEAVNGIPFVPQKLRNFPAILEHRKIQTNPL